MATRSIADVVLEPAAQEFAAATAKPPYLFDLGPQNGREVVDQVQSGEISKPDAVIEELSVPTPRGNEPTRITRPKGPSWVLPVLLYLLGAGRVFGNQHPHVRLVGEQGAGPGAAVAFPDYSLSPEARYP